jgi:predicted nucleic acid-binding protein
MGSVTLDASIVIGFLDGDDANHAAAVTALRTCRAERLLMSTVTLAEVLVRPAASGRVADVEQSLSRLDVRYVDSDADVARAAAALRAAHRAIALPDAIALATARLRDSELLTLDKPLARIAAGA